MKMRKCTRIVAAVGLAAMSIVMFATPSSAQKEPAAAPPVNEFSPDIAITPFVECYVLSADGGTATTYFGYTLTTPNASLAAGTGWNWFSAPSANVGQPSLYTTGTNHYVFNVSWPVNGPTPVWTINSATVSADLQSNDLCALDPNAPEFPVAAAGPVLAAGLVGGWFVLSRRRALGRGVIG